MTTPGPDGQSDQDRRAAQVRGYSRIVRWMKVALPVGAIMLIGLIFLTGKERGGVLDSTNADLAVLSAGLRLDNPRFAGVTDDGDPFVVTAEWALPDGAVPDRVELEAPQGEIRLGDGRVVNVTSKSGEMFRKDELLNLMGDVVLVTSDGYRVETSRVEVNLETKGAVAPSRVVAEGPRGGIEADTVEIIGETGDGKSTVMRFEGNVRVTWQPATDGE